MRFDITACGEIGQLYRFWQHFADEGCILIRCPFKNSTVVTQVFGTVLVLESSSAQRADKDLHWNSRGIPVKTQTESFEAGLVNKAGTGQIWGGNTLQVDSPWIEPILRADRTKEG